VIWRSALCFSYQAAFMILDSFFVATQPSPLEALPASTPACLRDSALRSCNPSPPIHGRRIGWRVNAC